VDDYEKQIEEIEDSLDENHGGHMRSLLSDLSEAPLSSSITKPEVAKALKTKLTSLQTKADDPDVEKMDSLEEAVQQEKHVEKKPASKPALKHEEIIATVTQAVQYGTIKMRLRKGVSSSVPTEVAGWLRKTNRAEQ